jgi:hypothetical protein
MRRFAFLALVLCGCSLERIDAPGPGPLPPPVPSETADRAFVTYAQGFASNCEQAASKAESGATEHDVFKWLDGANEVSRKSAFASIRLRIAATSPPEGEWNRTAFAAELRKVATEAKGLK